MIEALERANKYIKLEEDKKKIKKKDMKEKGKETRRNALAVELSKPRMNEQQRMAQDISLENISFSNISSAILAFV